MTDRAIYLATLVVVVLALLLGGYELSNPIH